MKILLVEDDSDQALLATESFEEYLEDAEITVCETGSEMLEMDLAEFDVILLDYSLSDMTGLDVLNELEDREHGPVIMVTAEEVLEIAVESLKRGADEFIIKTVDIHQLLPHIVERTFQNFQQRKNLEDIETREREKKVQIDTLKRIMMTLAHHINNGVMPIIFSAELCQRSEYNIEKTMKLVKTCLNETDRINNIIDKLERYIEDEEFKYADYLDLKDAMFDMSQPLEQE